MNKHFVYRITAGIIALLFLSSCAETPQTEAPENVQSANYQPISYIGKDGEYRIAAQNSRFTMLINPSDMDIRVESADKSSVFSTFPAQKYRDAITDRETLNNVMSHLTVSYFDDRNKENKLYSYGDSVQKQQMALFSIENGVRAEYTIGEPGSVSLLPEVLSQDAMEQKILPALSEDEKEFLLKYFKPFSYDTAGSGVREELESKYKNFSKISVYIAKNVGERIKGDVLEILTKAGFTVEALMDDYQKIGYNKQLEVVPSFKIPVEFTLEEQGFSVCVKYSEIAYERNFFKINTVETLPFFGCTPKEPDGYMLVPDGCGSIIYTENIGRQIYSQKFYNNDINTATSQNGSKTAPCPLPIFGIKNGNQAFLAVVEDGSALSTLTAATHNNPSGLNHSGIFFEPHPRMVYQATGLVLGSQIIKYGQKEYAGDLKIKYFLMSGTSADYSGMAAAYRQYLFAEKEKLIDSGISFYMDTYGIMKSDGRFMGVPVSSNQTFTDASEASEIVDELSSLGVSRMVLRYMNWSNDELLQSAVDAEPNKKLGNIKDLREDFQSKKIGFYPNFEVLSVKNGSFGSFAKTADKSDLTQTVGLFAVSDDKNRNLLKVFLSPKTVLSHIEMLSEKKENIAVSLSSIGNSLYTDFNLSDFSDREQSLSAYKKALNTIGQSHSLLLDGFNAYALPFAERIVNMPLSDSSYDFDSESVPFLPMAIHGYIDYASEPLNVTADKDKNALKCIEYGVSPRYILNYGDADFLKSTHYSDLLSTNYKFMKKPASEQYKKCAEMLGGLNGMTIISHKRLAEDVFCTVYENGEKIYVNYSDLPFKTGNSEVPAMGCLRAKEETE